ncbi:MAG: hypothetical protein ABIA63_14765, partial [bacterium]
MAQKSGLFAEEILTMKTEGKMGWGNIAKKLNLRPGKDYRSEKDLEPAEAKTNSKSARAEEKAMQKKMAAKERALEKKMDAGQKSHGKNK